MPHKMEKLEIKRVNYIFLKLFRLVLYIVLLVIGLFNIFVGQISPAFVKKCTIYSLRNFHFVRRVICKLKFEYSECPFHLCEYYFVIILLVIVLLSSSK